MKHLVLLIVFLALAGAGVMVLLSGTDGTTPTEDEFDDVETVEVPPTPAERDRPDRRGEGPRLDQPILEPEPVFEPEQGATDTILDGTVYSPAGNSVPDAIVTLCRASGTRSLLTGVYEKVKEPVLTDEAGQFRIAAIRGGSGYALKVEHGAYASTTITNIEVEKNQVNLAPKIVMRVGVGISGVITGEDTIAVEGAVVAAFSLTERSGQALRQVVTARDGVYRLQGLPLGVYEVAASAKGMRTVRSAPLYLMTASAQEKCNIVLSEGHTILGLVTDRLGKPVEGALVVAQVVRGVGASGDQTTSRSDGWFKLEGLSEGKYNLKITRKGFGPATRTGVAAGTKRLHIKLKPTVGVTGFVVRRDSKEPVKSFGLRLWQVNKNNQSALPLGDLRSFSSADGSFTIEDLLAGCYKVQAYAKNLAPAFSKVFDVTDTYVHGLRIPMNEGASLSGTVVDTSGSPVVGATVRLLDNAFRDSPLSGLVYDKFTKLGRTRTDDEGKFTFRTLAPDVYQLKVTAGSLSPMYERDIHVEVESETTCGPLVMSEGGHVKGSVSDSRQLPVAGARVMFSTTEEGTIAEVRTDSSGRFELNNVAPGNYIVSALPPTGSATESNIFSAIADSTKSALEVVVEEGLTRSINIYLP